MPSTDTSVVEGSYVMGDEDFVAFTRQLSRRSPSRVIGYVFVLVIIGSLGMFFEQSLSGGAGALFYLAIPIVMLLFLYGFAPWYRRWTGRRYSIWGQTVCVVAEPECLNIRHGNGSLSRTPWSDFAQRTRSESHFFFWYDRARALIIPLRAFADEAAVEQVWRMAQIGEPENVA